MKKNFAKILLSLTMVFACLFGFTACGSKDNSKKVSNLSVELVNTAYTLSDGTIQTTFEEGKKVALTAEDFKVTATFSDNTTEVLSVKTDKNPSGYVFESTVPDTQSTAAGEYKISFGHSDITDKTEISVKVGKATIDVDALGWDEDVFVYNTGTKHSVQLKNVPTGLKVDYSGDVEKEDYSENGYSTTATLTLEDTNNYEPLSKTTLTHSWAISKKRVEVPKVQFVDYTFEEGEEKTATIENINTFSNRKITVLISADGEGEKKTATNAGNYKVTLNYSINAEKAYNYELSKTSEQVEWEIKKANYTAEISVSSTNLVYNGSEQEVTLDYTKINNNIVEVDSANIVGNKKTNAGNYSVVVPITVKNNNYHLTNQDGKVTLEWEIAKKSITFEFTEVTEYIYGDSINLAGNALIGKINTTNTAFCGTDSWSQINSTNISARIGKYVNSNFVDYSAGREYGSVGNYTILVENVEAANYEISFNGTDKIKVNKKNLKVIANKVTLNYGDEFEWNNVRYEGFANGDDQNVLKGKDKLTYETTYTKESVPGTSCTVTPKGLDEQDNYVVEYVAGNVEIVKARLVVTPSAANNSIVYGSETSALGEISFNLVGAKNNDDVSKILKTNYTIAYGIKTSSGIDGYTANAANGGVGVYSIIIYDSDLSEYATARYDITLSEGSFTVTRKSINLEIATINITYGDSLADLKTAIGKVTDLLVLSSGESNTLVADDELSSVIDHYSELGSETLTFRKNGVPYAAGRANGSAGTYDAFTEISFTSTNYELDINYLNKLVVSPKPIEIVINSSTITYGEEPKNNGFYVRKASNNTSNIVAGDEEYFNSLTPTYSYSYKQGDNTCVYVAGTSGVSKVDINATVDDVENYTITVASDMLYVEPRKLTVTTLAEKTTIVYGEDFSTANCKVQYSGNLEKDKDAINSALSGVKFLVGIADGDDFDTTSKNVGTYQIRVQKEDGNEITISDYKLEFNYGTLAVSKKVIELELAISGTYGDSIDMIASGIKISDDDKSSLLLKTGSSLAWDDKIADVYAGFSLAGNDLDIYQTNDSSLKYERTKQNGKAGNYTLKISKDKFATKNYEIASDLVQTITIKPKTLNIKAKDTEIFFGEEAKNDGYELDDSSFVYGDTGDSIISGTATYTYYRDENGTKINYVPAQQNTGGFHIEISGFECNDENYNIVYEFGTMTVKAATITSSLAKWQADGKDLSATVKDGESESKIEWDATIEATGKDISLNLTFGYTMASCCKFKYSLDNNTWTDTISVKEAGNYTIYAKLELGKLGVADFSGCFKNKDIQMILSLKVEPDGSASVDEEDGHSGGGVDAGVDDSNTEQNNESDGGEYASASNPNSRTSDQTVASAAIIQSVSYTKLNLETGSLDDVELNDGIMQVATFGDEDISESEDLFAQNEIITNFSVKVAAGYTYKLFADEDLTEELDLNNLNGYYSSIFVVAYDENGNEVEYKEYLLGDIKYSFSIIHNGVSRKMADLISEVHYLGDDETLSWTLFDVSDGITITASFSVSDSEGIEVVNNGYTSSLTLDQGYAKEVTYTFKITYNELQYTFSTSFVVVNTMSVNEIDARIMFNDSQLEDNKIELSGDIESLDLDNLKIKGAKVISKSLEKVGEYYFIKVEILGDVSETLWLEVVFE